MATDPATQRIDLLAPVQLIHDLLSPALCEQVFEEVRTEERRREVTLLMLAHFWTAVVLRAPASLTHALQVARGQEGRGLGYPAIPASDQAFFQRSQDLRPEFFEAILRAFLEAVRPQAPAVFAAEHRSVIERFAGVLCVDGSKADAVAHRLKITWRSRARLLPGAILAFYDLPRGILRDLVFDPDAKGSEFRRAQRQLDSIERDTLVIGDRGFGVAKFFTELGPRGLWALVRRFGPVKVEDLELISRWQTPEGELEDFRVQVGPGGGRSEPKQTLRLLRLVRAGRKRIELLTNVLDPARLSAREALDLYRRRWTVERLFFDLKEVLNLNRFYAANTNAIAMQVYATAIVYVAMRVVQAKASEQADVAPEALSTAKLFPFIAAASEGLTTAEITFEATRRVNPGVKLNKPSWDEMPFASVPLKAILVETRKEPRRTRRYCASRATWTNLPRTRRRRTTTRRGSLS